MKLNLAQAIKLRAAHELDEAKAVQWVQDATAADIEKVWDAIQSMPNEGVSGVVSRAAQLGMTHAILLSAAKENR